MSTQKSMPRVFVVDDEPNVARAIGQSVAFLGCEVEAFHSGRDCLAALESKDCDLLITDVNMPEMDGLALLQKVKECQPLIPIVVVTAYGDIPMAVKAMRDGAMDFIQKPLDEETLMPAVKRALRAHEFQKEFSITQTEMAIFKLVADGKSSREIAEFTQRSVRTVENHRHRLMKKLNVETTTALVKIALHLGISSGQGVADD